MPTPGATPHLCIDVGSTFTKGLLVGSDGAVLGAASHPTTIGTDVMDGVRAVAAALNASDLEPLVCSSAGGGLRLAVIGHEREVTAHAGHRVGLSSGAKVVHVAAGELDGDGVRELRAATPDIILLVGGTDGGNANVLRHNAIRLAKARVKPPIIVAGNAMAADEIATILGETGRRFVISENVLPRIGVINPEPARAAIRAVFLEHVIGGKGLSRGDTFARLVRAATPDAVLAGVKVIAAQRDSDILVVDIGGATTDVYSAIRPQGEDAALAKDVVAPLWQARTVEGDLGMRWSALGVTEAARAEAIALSDNAIGYAERVAANVALLPIGAADWAAEAEIARAAATIAARRHARPAQPSESPRPLQDVSMILGSGGVLRHSATAAPDLASQVLTGIRDDHAGGWRTPVDATTAVDDSYVLFAIGLLTPAHPALARDLAARVSG